MGWGWFEARVCLLLAVLARSLGRCLVHMARSTDALQVRQAVVVSGDGVVYLGGEDRAAVGVGQSAGWVSAEDDATKLLPVRWESCLAGAALPCHGDQEALRPVGLRGQRSPRTMRETVALWTP